MRQLLQIQIMKYFLYCQRPSSLLEGERDYKYSSIVVFVSEIVNLQTMTMIKIIAIPVP